MSVLVRFSGGEEVPLEVEPQDWAKLFEKALREGGVIEILDPDDGERIGINPQTVLYWKSGPETRDRP
jgi:hypothetical protein